MRHSEVPALYTTDFSMPIQYVAKIMVQVETRWFSIPKYIENVE